MAVAEFLNSWELGEKWEDLTNKLKQESGLAAWCEGAI